MQRTIKEWFECFPEPWRYKAIRIAKIEGTSDYIRETPLDALCSMAGKSWEINWFREAKVLIPLWEKEGRFEPKDYHQEKLDKAIEEMQKQPMIVEPIYTAEDMCEFADWVAKNAWKHDFREQRKITTAELLQIFINRTKQLKP